MSFGYAIGDVIAVLGLIERVAIELRNYKDAPSHFQQLRVELDLVQSTLQHVLRLEPESDEERQTLDQIRAIVVHCSQPVQVMADKMRSKESSLGHFRTTRSLSSIGTRLHWSMVAQSDVDSFRKTIMSEMAAINILLSVQQLQAKALDRNLKAINTNIDDLSRKTGKTSTMIQRHAKRLFRLMQDIKEMFTLFAKCSQEMLEAISRNTRMLLDITGQLKRIMRAIEAIPMHLTLDIVRLDDAHGESWALPLQACRTWNSFSNMLRLVVYANMRPGADLIVQNRFSIMMAQNGMELNARVWERFIKSGLHIEQAMVVSRASSLGENCADSRCSGKVINQAVQLDQHRKVCTSCGRWTTSQTITAPLVELYGPQTQEPVISQTRATRKPEIGPQLPPMQLEEEPEAFRRVTFYQTSPPIKDFEDARYRLDKDARDPAANAFFGFTCLQDGEERGDADLLRRSKQHLEITVTSARAVHLSPWLFEPWYNLGVLYDRCCQPSDAADAFQRCIECNPEFLAAQARLRVIRSQISAPNTQVSSDDLKAGMYDGPLRMRYDGVLEAEGDNIVINPIRERGVLEEDDYSGDDSDYDDSEYEENEFEDSDYEDSGSEGDDSWTRPAEPSVSEPMA
ncbi:hypothetical protein NCS57_00904800 [Fusarium keratoplasticum]|uniref:Uncharacterized protein n=1 Tax=Fusarium keratoplasticum TaxID=1328300 RepID=A0ACC0QXG4_9HYPO|nr:hypothetical protein NCS57_00904800 [Fusarium keratoplasticum]KAI8666780.1 hypothetical protein NCS57_00904800 [Fusarium keratoplasticum]